MISLSESKSYIYGIRELNTTVVFHREVIRLDKVIRVEFCKLNPRVFTERKGDTLTLTNTHIDTHMCKNTHAYTNTQCNHTCMLTYLHAHKSLLNKWKDNLFSFYNINSYYL